MLYKTEFMKIYQKINTRVLEDDQCGRKTPSEPKTSRELAKSAKKFDKENKHVPQGHSDPFR